MDMTDNINTRDRMFREIAGANPEVSQLVQELDLRDSRTGLPYGADGHTAEERRKLVSIAQRVLNRGQIYSYEQVVTILGERLGIPRQRAVNGFEMMMSSGVLSSIAGQGIRLAV